MTDRTNEFEVPVHGTRGAWSPFGGSLNKLFQPLINMLISRYRKKAGPTPTLMMGFPVVLLTTTGAKTGRDRTQMLGGFVDGEDEWLVVAANGGSKTQPAWVMNIAKNPDKVWLEPGNRKLKVKAALLRGDEREAALARVVARAPQYGKYEKITDRKIPVIRLARDV